MWSHPLPRIESLARNADDWKDSPPNHEAAGPNAPKTAPLKE
jgi:hypothetical protein